MKHSSRLLVFHRTIAPYRIDFFNSLSKAFETRVCLQYKNLLNQKFDYEKILEQLDFSPVYLKELARVKNTIISTGYWKNLNETNPDIVLVSEFGLDCIATLLHKWIYRKKWSFHKKNYPESYRHIYFVFWNHSNSFFSRVWWNR